MGYGLKVNLEKVQAFILAFQMKYIGRIDWLRKLALHHLFGKFEVTGRSEQKEYKSILGFHVVKKIVAKYKRKILPVTVKAAG